MQNEYGGIELHKILKKIYTQIIKYKNILQKDYFQQFSYFTYSRGKIFLTLTILSCLIY